MNILAFALSNVAIAALLAVPAWLAGLWGRRPALTHALWLLVLIKLVTPPLFGCSIALPTLPEPVANQAEIAVADPAPARVEPTKPQETPPASPEPPVGNLEITRVTPEIEPTVTPASNPVVNDVNPREQVEPIPPWGAVDFLLLAWAAGSLGWMTLAVIRVRRFHRVVRFAQPAPDHVQDVATNLAWALQVRCPEIGLLAGNVSPMLWAPGRSPRLLLPADLLVRLTPDQLATLLAHELAHWQRRDDRVRLLEFAVLAIYWWCPLAWWAHRQLHLAEEECCDAWVVSLLPESAKAYALAIVETVDFLSGAPAPLPLAASGLGRVRFLKRRLTMILQAKTPRTLTFTGLLGVAALGLLMLPLVFSKTQEVQVGAQVPANREDPARAEQLDKARREVQLMARELELMKREMQKQQEILRERAVHLEDAMRRLREIEAAGAGGAPAGRADPSINGAPGGPGGAPGGRGTGGHADNNIDQRLKRVEAKLDTILDELRKMKQTPRGAPAAERDPNPMPTQAPDVNPFSRPKTEAPQTTPRNDPTLPLDTPLPK